MTDLPAADLRAAYDGSYYFIAGAGGDLQEWVDGYEKMLAEEGIGKPTGWFTTTGAAVNDYAFTSGWRSDWDQCFDVTLTCLLFPLDGLDITRLPIFKIKMADRWFDDVIANMRDQRRQA